MIQALLSGWRWRYMPFVWVRCRYNSGIKVWGLADKVLPEGTVCRPLLLVAGVNGHLHAQLRMQGTPNQVDLSAICRLHKHLRPQRFNAVKDSRSITAFIHVATHSADLIIHLQVSLQLTHGCNLLETHSKVIPSVLR